MLRNERFRLRGEPQPVFRKNLFLMELGLGTRVARQIFAQRGSHHLGPAPRISAARHRRIPGSRGLGEPIQRDERRFVNGNRDCFHINILSRSYQTCSSCPFYLQLGFSVSQADAFCRSSNLIRTT